MKSKSSSGLPHYLFALIAVIVVHFMCLRYLQGFDFYGGGGIRWIPFFISFLPPLFLFSLIAVVLSGELSATLVIILEIVLSLIHRKKVFFLGEPLNGGDLFNIVGHKIGIRYLTIFDWTLVLCLLVAVILQFRFITYRKKNKLIGFSLNSLLFTLIISPLVLFPHLQNRSFFGQEWINHWVYQAGVGYYVPDLLQNQRFNGLPLHLIQTSVRPVPSRATETQKNLFMNFSKKMLKTERPRHIIFILCESCWADKDNFQEVFKTLASLNFIEVRAISPVFGGLTPNASFEILTGLPSDSDSIQGVIFQDYADLLKDEVLTIPQKLKQQGYKTIAMHNFHKRMWQREKVLKKFGFEKFVSLEDLDYQGDQMWPPDKILYEAALEVIKENRNDPLFLYLITVSTHGPYASTGSDDGEADYSEKLKVALQDLKQFITELNQLSKDPFIFVFSDHKPALPEYFKKRGLMGDQEKKGDVPVLIRDPSFKKKVSNIEYINRLPFFCLIQKVDELYLNSKLPVFSFAESQGICQKNGKKYSDYKSSYPSWLYSLSLFEELPKPASTPPLRSSLDF